VVLLGVSGFERWWRGRENGRTAGFKKVRTLRGLGCAGDRR
jgi:hypothetical protein